MDGLDGLDWTGIIQTVAVVAALLLAGYQTRRLVVESRERDAEKRVQRALEMYRDLVVDGDTATAFHRLSTRLRGEGMVHCGVVTWYLPTDEDLALGGLMDPNDTGFDSPFADLYRVMWYFERARLALDHDLIDREVFLEAAGFHVWWWNQVLRHVGAPKAMESVRRLEAEVRIWAENAHVLEIWSAKCLTDFNGGPPVPTC